MNSYKPVKRFLVASAALSLFMAVCCFMPAGCITEKEEPVRSLSPGDMLPDFRITLDNGEIISTDMLKGRGSVIVFFDTSCPDCRRELPLLQQEYDRSMADGDLTRYICISRAEGKESVQRYWEENRLTMPYSAQTDRSVYDLFASSGIPRVYRADASLRIVSVTAY